MLPNCVLAKFQLHLSENVLGQIQIVSLQIPIASHRKHSKTIPNCVLAKCQMHIIQENSEAHSNCFLAKIQSHLSKKLLGQFQIVP